MHHIEKGSYLSVVLNQLIDMNKHCRWLTHNYNWATTTDFIGCSIVEIPTSPITRTLLRVRRLHRVPPRLHVSATNTGWWRRSTAALAPGRSTEQLLHWKMACPMEDINVRWPPIQSTVKMSTKMPPRGTQDRWEETQPWGLTWALTESLRDMLRTFLLTGRTLLCKVCFKGISLSIVCPFLISLKRLQHCQWGGQCGSNVSDEHEP